MKSLKSEIKSKEWELLRHRFSKSAKEDPILRNMTDAQRGTLIDDIMSQSVEKIKAEIMLTWECPLVKKSGWDCAFDKMQKGQEPFCHNIGHFKCPSFNRHFAYVLHNRIAKARNKPA